MKIIIVAAAAFFLFWLQAALYRRMWNRNLTVALYFKENTMFAGQQGHLCEQIENAKYFPIPILKVKFQCRKELDFELSQNAAVTDLYYRNDVFSVMPMQKITRCLTFTAKKRGYYNIKSVDLIGTDFLLSSENISVFPVENSIYVYPKPLKGQFWEQALKKLNGQMAANSYWLEDPFTFRGIREYVPGDDLKRINWKATAKTEELRVNERNDTTLHSVRIFLNLEDSGILKSEDRIETAVSMAAGLAESFIRQEYMVSLYCSSIDCVTKQITRIRESSGESHMELIYRMLARLDTEEKPHDFASEFEEELRNPSKDCFAVFVTVNLYTEFVQVLNAYGESGGEFCCFIPVSGTQKKEAPKGLENKVQFIAVEKLYE